jgi:UDP:flavonoid glycosyltransferase YjiC (YdhE family)
MGKLFIAPTNRFRKRVGAPLVRDLSGLMSGRMILVPVSRHVAVPDPRWPAHVCTTGYWFAREQPGWTPPPGLEEFLQAGSPPAAVSLGVMGKAGKLASEAADIILEALVKTGVRAVVQGWDEALQGRKLPDSIYCAGSLPHRWLFDRVSTVIHHGGFGTTASVLRSGVPGIVVPHIIDQFYWGQRVTELGAGPGYLPRGKLSVERLSAALERALQDAELRQRAAALGQAIRAEPDGVTTAVQMIAGL